MSGSSDQGILLGQTASHWDEKAKAQKAGLITRWWESPALRQLVDDNWHAATGCPTVADYIRREAKRQSLGTGISIGCGAAEDEINLLHQGVIERLILCDVSNEQLSKAEAYAKSLGIASGSLVHRNHVDFDRAFPEKLDLIYWRQSLHHMFDVRRTLEWCRDSLTPAGAIYCNDACPPNYMQWGDDVLHWVEAYRASLPQRYLKSPFDADVYYPARPWLLDVDYWKARDPTECVDSANIVPSIRALAPSARIHFLGGCIYGFALDDILDNFRAKDDARLLESAMILDKFMSSCGMNIFFTCVIRKDQFR